MSRFPNIGTNHTGTPKTSWLTTGLTPPLQTFGNSPDALIMTGANSNTHMSDWFRVLDTNFSQDRFLLVGLGLIPTVQYNMEVINLQANIAVEIQCDDPQNLTPALFATTYNSGTPQTSSHSIGVKRPTLAALEYVNNTNSLSALGHATFELFDPETFENQTPYYAGLYLFSSVVQTVSIRGQIGMKSAFGLESYNEATNDGQY
jgi:hypothetical protein